MIALYLAAIGLSRLKGAYIVTTIRRKLPYWVPCLSNPVLQVNENTQNPNNPYRNEKAMNHKIRYFTLPDFSVEKELESPVYCFFKNHCNVISQITHFNLTKSTLIFGVLFFLFWCFYFVLIWQLTDTALTGCEAGRKGSVLPDNTANLTIKDDNQHKIHCNKHKKTTQLSIIIFQYFRLRQELKESQSSCVCPVQVRLDL